MTKVRGVALALLLLGLVAAAIPLLGLAGAPEETVRGTPSAAEDPGAVDPDDFAVDPDDDTAPEGPRIDADDDGPNNAVIGTTAVVLLIVVIWGRWIRNKRWRPQTSPKKRSQKS